jgi:hypothetical protein
MSKGRPALAGRTRCGQSEVCDSLQKSYEKARKNALVWGRFSYKGSKLAVKKREFACFFRKNTKSGSCIYLKLDIFCVIVCK